MIAALTKNNRNLNWLSLAVSLVSLHFGLGFLIGTGEAIYNQGSKGILYALSTALGLFSLILISPYYWKNKLPIWNIMGARYGKVVKNFVAFLSTVWMIGVLASQILGGASALTIFGINKFIAMLLIATPILLVSLTDFQKLAKILLAMLLFTCFTLVFIQISFGTYWVSNTYQSILSSIPGINSSDILGVVLPTILVTFIGMDFHQFIVRSRSVKDAVLGNLSGGIILLTISFLTLNLINASLKTGFVQHLADPKQTIPIILFNFGKSINPSLGILLPLGIIFVAIGSGSGVQRIVSDTLKSFSLLRAIAKTNKSTALIVSGISVVLALTGKSIINLIVNFYAIYVGCVFIPFAFLLLERKIHRIKITPKAVELSLSISFLATVLAFLSQFFPTFLSKTNTSIAIIFSGFTASLLTLLVFVVTKLVSRKQPEESV